MEKTYFGKLKDGTDVYQYAFTNQNKVTLKLIDLGAIWTDLLVPDRDGVLRNVVLGYDTPQEYVDNGCYFGAVIGRSGNRIDKGHFVINGKDYQLAINDNENNLHSGPSTYQNRKWAVKAIDEEKNSICFGLFSPDGDQGYPGNLEVTVTYTLTEDNEVILHYEGVSDADTTVNMTNHVYFNLDGHDSGSIENHTMQIFADYYNAVRDGQAIPTGEMTPVAGTPMDFRAPKTIGQDIRADFDQLKYVLGYDHNYVLRGKTGIRKQMAEVKAAKSGITMEAYTQCCAMQFYAGNCINEHGGRGGVTYVPRTGFCLESQYCPNAINQEGFERPLLKAGEKYDSTTSYKFICK